MGYFLGVTEGWFALSISRDRSKESPTESDNEFVTYLGVQIMNRNKLEWN
jgi:hypothetical protein